MSDQGAHIGLGRVGGDCQHRACYDQPVGYPPCGGGLDLCDLPACQRQMLRITASHHCGHPPTSGVCQVACILRPSKNVSKPWPGAVEQRRQGLRVKRTHLSFVDHYWIEYRLKRPRVRVMTGHIGNSRYPDKGRAAVHGFSVHQPHCFDGAANDINHFRSRHIVGYFMPLHDLLKFVADGAHVIAVGCEIRGPGCNMSVGGAIDAIDP